MSSAVEDRASFKATYFFSLQILIDLAAQFYRVTALFNTIMRCGPGPRYANSHDGFVFAEPHEATKDTTHEFFRVCQCVKDILDTRVWPHNLPLLCAKHSRELGTARARIKAAKFQTETLPLVASIWLGNYW